MSGLPRGWVKTKISDVYDVARGGSPRPIKDFVTSDPNGLNWIRIADASAGGYRIQAAEQKIDKRGLNKTREVFPGDLLLSNSMSFGRPYITDIQGCIHDGWLVLGGPATRHVDTEFAYRCLSSPKVQRQFDEKASGTTVRNLNTDLVNSVQIEIPPLAEQKRIVAKLDALNAKSARARTELARIETLVIRYKQAVLSKAFCGELTKEWRDIQAKATGWPNAAISDIAEVVTGSTPKTAEKDRFFGGDTPFFKPTDLDQGYHVETPRETLSAAGVAVSRLVPARSVLVTCIGATIGKVGFARVACCTNQQINALVPNIAVVRAEWLYWVISSPDFQALILANSSATTLPIINKGRFQQLPLGLPPVEEQHEIVRRIESAFAKIDRLAKEAKRALELVGRLDEAILAKAFRGELVPQDENDEPAEYLLARIRAEREAAPKGKRGRGAKG